MLAGETKEEKLARLQKSVQMAKEIAADKAAQALVLQRRWEDRQEARKTLQAQREEEDAKMKEMAEKRLEEARRRLQEEQRERENRRRLYQATVRELNEDIEKALVGKKEAEEEIKRLEEGIKAMRDDTRAMEEETKRYEEEFVRYREEIATYKEEVAAIEKFSVLSKEERNLIQKWVDEEDITNMQEKAKLLNKDRPEQFRIPDGVIENEIKYGILEKAGLAPSLPPAPQK